MTPFFNEKFNYLITTDNWFQGPNGKQYRGAWGKISIVLAKDLFGFNPTRSTNWFAQIGEGNKSIIIAGCQINYAIRCDNKPKVKKVKCKNNPIYIP